MSDKKSQNFTYMSVALPILIFLLMMALLKLVVNSVNVVSQTNKDNFIYTVKMRNSIAEIDSIINRVGINLSSFVYAISQTYEDDKLYNLNYNVKYLRFMDVLVKSTLVNSPGVNGAWFQLNVDIPFSEDMYLWYGYKDGRLIRYKIDKYRKLNPKEDSYYFETVANKKITWSDIYTDADNGVKMVSICMPIYKNDKLIGVAGIDISIENLQTALKNMQKVFDKSEVFLLNDKKQVILSQLAPGETDTNDAENFLPLFYSPRNIFNQKQEKLVEYSDNGVSKTAIMLDLSNKYNVVLTFPNRDVFKGFNELFAAIYLVFLILAVLAIFAYINKKNLIQSNLDLQAEKDKIRTIFEASPTMILVKDLNGKYIDCNDLFLGFVGMTRDKLIGKSDKDFYTQDEVDEMQLNEMIAIKSGRMVIAESAYYDEIGEKFFVEKYIAPLKNHRNEVFCLFILSIDITKKKQEQELLMAAKEAAEKATQLKSSFLANMSHEIRTPMNGVLGFIQLLKETNPTEEQAEFIDAAEKSSELFLAVINDILDFSKIEAGKLQIERISFDIRSVVEDMTIMGTTIAESKNLDVNSLICSDVPRKIFGDPARLKQILSNLIGNAIKFTHQGEVVIYVKLVSTENNVANIRFEVKDTGIGIEDDKINIIFNPFTQNDASTTRKYGGTGLGLAICKKLVDLKGGDIRVESKIGEGSTFIVDLPFEIDTSESEEKNNLISSLDGLKILIIDRNPTDQKIIRYYLNEANCIIYEATNPVNALSILTAKNINIDVVLVEHKIQNESNISSIIKSDSRWKNIPLVLYTSYASKIDLLKLEQSDFKGYLTKPIKKMDLIETLSNLINDDYSNPADAFLQKNSIQKFDSSAKLLVVEDSDLNCKLISKILENHGLAYDLVYNGAEAVGAFKNYDYDVILMDCQMPILNGYEATKEIRALESGSQHVPIIAMTANALARDEIKCLEVGMDDYISKPIKIDKLFKILSKYLSVESNLVSEANDNVLTVDDAQAGGEHFEISSIVKGMTDSLGLSQDDAIQFLIEYLGFIPEINKEINVAVESKDFESLRLLGHKLKGASANLRINKIAALASELENEAPNKDIKKCSEIVAKIKRCFDIFDVSFSNSPFSTK